MSTVAEESIFNGGNMSTFWASPKVASSNNSIRPILKPAVRQSLLVQDPPGSTSNSPFAPKSGLASTMKGGGIPELQEAAASRRLEESLKEAQVLDATSCLPEKTISVDSSADDPYLMLNASKAPSPTSANRTISPDPCWGEEETEDNKQPPAGGDPNVSLLPDCTTLESPDVTMWEEETLLSADTFSFAAGDLVAEAVLRPQSTASSSSRGQQACLRDPRGVAVVPQLGLLLVTEPSFNRIGIFALADFKFAGWFQYGSCQNPTNILCAGDTLAILERRQILLFSLEKNECHPQATIPGKFKGLTSGPFGEIITLMSYCTEKSGTQRKATETFTHFLAVIRPGATKITDKIPLESVSSSLGSEMLFLHSVMSGSSKHKVIITDPARHRLVEVSVDEGKARCGGYLGSSFGQFNTPTGRAP